MEDSTSNILLFSELKECSVKSPTNLKLIQSPLNYVPKHQKIRLQKQVKIKNLKSKPSNINEKINSKKTEIKQLLQCKLISNVKDVTSNVLPNSISEFKQGFLKKFFTPLLKKYVAMSNAKEMIELDNKLNSNIEGGYLTFYNLEEKNNNELMKTISMQLRKLNHCKGINFVNKGYFNDNLDILKTQLKINSDLKLHKTHSQPKLIHNHSYKLKRNINNSSNEKNNKHSKHVINLPMTHRNIKKSRNYFNSNIYPTKTETASKSQYDLSKIFAPKDINKFSVPKFSYLSSKKQQIQNNKHANYIFKTGLDIQKKFDDINDKEHKLTSSLHKLIDSASYEKPVESRIKKDLEILAGVKLTNKSLSLNELIRLSIENNLESKEKKYAKSAINRIFDNSLKLNDENFAKLSKIICSQLKKRKIDISNDLEVRNYIEDAKRRERLNKGIKTMNKLSYKIDLMTNKLAKILKKK